MVTKKELKLYADISPDFSLGEIKVIYKKQKPTHKITSSNIFYEFCKSLYNPDTVALEESFYIVFCDKANQIIGWNKMSTGSIDGTVVDQKKAVAMALKLMAQAVIFTHNHPSGNLKISEADIKLTKELKDMFNVFKISLLDHIIYTEHGYTSFSDEGIL